MRNNCNNQGNFAAGSLCRQFSFLLSKSDSVCGQAQQGPLRYI